MKVPKRQRLMAVSSRCTLQVFHQDCQHGSGTFRTPRLFFGSRRFGYLERRGARRWVELMYVTRGIYVDELGNNAATKLAYHSSFVL